MINLMMHELFYKIDYLPVKDYFWVEDLMPEALRGFADQQDCWTPMFSTSVQCGLFGIQDDYIGQYLSLDERYIKNKHSSFIFKMEGDSMFPYIHPGDHLIVDRSLQSFNNRIVVVDIYDERLCKFLIQKEGKTILRSLNTKYPDIIVTEEMNMQIFGVGTLCFRDLDFKK